MFKLKRWLALLLMGMAGGILMISGAASAMNIQKVDTDKLLAKEADFKIDSKAENADFKLDVQIPKGLSKQITHYDADEHLCRGVFNGHKVDYIKLTGSDGKNKLNRQAKVVATYPYIGTYKNQRVGAKVTFSNFTSPDLFELYVCRNFYYGFWSSYRPNSEADVNVKIIDVNGNPVNMENSYLSIGSLNGKGYWGNSEYIGMRNYNSAYMVSDPTCLKTYKSINGKNDVIGGQRTGYDDYEWTDSIGGRFFERSTVAMNFNGNADLLFGQGPKGSWFTINSTPLQPYVENPKKSVSANGSAVNGKNVMKNQKVVWKITQKMPVKGITCNSSFKSLEFVDKMDKKLEILKDDVSLNDDKGNKYNLNDVGTVSVDSNNVLRIKTKESFYTNSALYDGRTFSISIPTKAKSTGKIENTGQTVVNNQTLNSNSVSVNVVPPDFPSPVKSASISQVSFDGKEFTYDVKQQKRLIDTYI